MWRSKKFIIIALLTVVVMAGTLGGVVLADTDDTGSPVTSLLDRAIQIYEENTGVTINAAALRDAFSQARDELKTEARDRFHQRLIDEGKITEEQLEEFKTWMESRPDIGPFGEHRFSGHRGFGRFWSFHGGKAPDITE